MTNKNNTIIQNFHFVLKIVRFALTFNQYLNVRWKKKGKCRLNLTIGMSIDLNHFELYKLMSYSIYLRIQIHIRWILNSKTQSYDFFLFLFYFPVLFYKIRWTGNWRIPRNYWLILYNNIFYIIWLLGLSTSCGLLGNKVMRANIL